MPLSCSPYLWKRGKIFCERSEVSSGSDQNNLSFKAGLFLISAWSKLWIQKIQLKCKYTKILIDNTIIHKIEMKTKLKICLCSFFSELQILIKVRRWRLCQATKARAPWGSPTRTKVNPQISAAPILEQPKVHSIIFFFFHRLSISVKIL